MIRKIIKIDEEKCNGCGACAEACHEGAIDIVDGKAKLAREHYCDGLGDCLPNCPMGAITFEERDAPAYDEQAVNASKQQKASKTLPCGCPSTHSHSISRANHSARFSAEPSTSQLAQWPCQIKLAPPNAPYFNNAHLLVAADCTAYAYASIHNDFMQGKVTLIGCPKLDGVDYSAKLTEILQLNDVQSVTVLRMQVPCCGGLEMAVRKAITNSKKSVPCRVVIVTINGEIL